MRRRLFSRRIWLGPSVSTMLGNGAQRNASCRAFNQHFSQSARAAVFVAQPQDDVEALRLIDDLRDDPAI